MIIYNTQTISNCIKKSAFLASKKSKEFENVVIFCEDKITLSLEIEIANLLNGGFMNIDVLTFKRYIASKSLNDSVLSKESSVMAVRKLIIENKNEFNCFKNSILKPNLPIILYELISQLKSAKISVEDLKEIITNKTQSLAFSLSAKIADIYLIYKKYEEYLKENRLIDSSDYLSTMLDMLKNDESIKNSYVLLVGFSTITKQRAEIFNLLSRLSKGIDAVVINDKNGEFYTGEISNKLLKIIENSREIFDDTPLNEDATILKNYLFNPKVFNGNFTKFNTNNVCLFESYSPKQEIESVARDILLEIKEGKKRFKDLSISVGDLDSYIPIFKKVFSEYGIPYFVDKNKILSEHPICDFTIAYLELVKSGFNREEFINFVSNPLFCQDKSLTDDLIEYVLKHSLGRNGLKKPFEESDEQLLKFEELRIKAYNAFELFKNTKTADEYVLNVIKTFESVNIQSNLEVLGQKLKLLNEQEYLSFNEKAYEKLNDILNEVKVLLKGIPISVSNFLSVLLSGMTATSIGSIPIYNDAVYIGSIKDVKIKNADVLYAVGLNGEIPFSQSDTALLTDSDLYELDKFKIIVEPKIRVVNLRERQNVCLSLISFNQKLKVSCANTTINGKENQRSEIIKYLYSIFDIKIKKQPSNELLKENDEVSTTAIKYFNEGSALREIASNSFLYNSGDIKTNLEVSSFYSAVDTDSLKHLKDDADEILAKKEDNKIFIDSILVENYNGNNISATVLENYFACPYSNYAKNVLRLKDSQTGEIKPFETGNLLHLIMEKFLLKVNEVNSKESSDILVEKIFEEILSLTEYKKFINNVKFSYVKKALLSESKRVCYENYKQLSNSLFKPYLLEQSFDENSKFKPIILKSKKGEFKLRGKVDRIDKYKNNIRVIDYKTGSIKPIDENFYTGNKIQLYLYMNAFVKGELSPSGAYYFPVNDEFSEKEETPYKMQGKTLNEEEIFIASDKDVLENKKGKSTGIRLKKDGQVYANSPILQKEEMDSYLEYAIKISEKGLEEFTSGYIKPSPYKGSCKYCNYNAMCGFCVNQENSEDSENADSLTLNGKERKEKNVRSSTIVNAVKKSRGGNENAKLWKFNEFSKTVRFLW